MWKLFKKHPLPDPDDGAISPKSKDMYDPYPDEELVRLYEEAVKFLSDPSRKDKIDVKETYDYIQVDYEEVISDKNTETVRLVYYNDVGFMYLIIGDDVYDNLYKKPFYQHDKEEVWDSMVDTIEGMVDRDYNDAIERGFEFLKGR